MGTDAQLLLSIHFTRDFRKFFKRPNFNFREEDHNNAANYNFDSPNALDFDLAYEKINGLLRYEDVEIPIYDFATHKR